MSNDAVRAEISNFFDGYAALFDSGDWTEFARLFHSPAVSVRGDGSVHVLSSVEEAASFFKAVADAWRREGYEHFTISDMAAVSMGSRSRLATLTWHMRTRDGREIRQWRQSYQLVEVNERWCVLSSTFHISESSAARRT